MNLPPPVIGPDPISPGGEEGRRRNDRRGGLRYAAEGLYSEKRSGYPFARKEFPCFFRVESFTLWLKAPSRGKGEWQRAEKFRPSRFPILPKRFLGIFRIGRVLDRMIPLMAFGKERKNLGFPFESKRKRSIQRERASKAPGFETGFSADGNRKNIFSKIDTAEQRNVTGNLPAHEALPGF